MFRPIHHLAMLALIGCTPDQLAELPADSLAPPPAAISVTPTQVTAFGGLDGIDEWTADFNPTGQVQNPRAAFFGNAVDSTAPEGRPTHPVSSPWGGGLPYYVEVNDLDTVGLDFDAADSVAFVPHGGDNPEFGNVDLKGESYVLVKSDPLDGGVGTYVHVGPRYYLNGPRDAYMTGMTGLHPGLAASSAGIRLRQIHRTSYPFNDPNNNATDLRIELDRSKMAVADLPPPSVGVAQCRFNNNITLDNDRTGHFVTLNLRSFTVHNDPGVTEDLGTGKVNLADPTHYNLYPSQGTTRSRSIRDRNTGGVMGRSYGDAHGDGEDAAGIDMDVVVTFSQFKRILQHLADAENTTRADLFGSEWDHRSAWRVKAVSARMEITGPQQDTEYTRCGGSLGELRVSGRPR